MVDGEADFDCDLIVSDAAVVDVASCFEDFEPTEVADCLAGGLDRVLDGGFD